MNATATRREVEVDTEIAALHDHIEVLQHTIVRSYEALHSYVQDERVGSSWSKNRPWALTNPQVLAKVAAKDYPSYYGPSIETQLLTLDKAKAALAPLNERLQVLNREFHANPWSRFFLVQDGHIHSSTDCSTCNRGRKLTRFGWLPELSGLTEADAVAAHGAILCTVCFPSAPVEWTNGHELEAEAKKAAQCAGSGTYHYEAQNQRLYRRWEVCTDCGQAQSVTSTGKLRAHKPA